ncbi:DUF2334 domain-containing protein [Paenibacillus sp. P25]|nr:DUF2334 domain-containing protein [Paenibacillus sp. P25]
MLAKRIVLFLLTMGMLFTLPGLVSAAEIGKAAKAYIVYTSLDDETRAWKVYNLLGHFGLEREMKLQTDVSDAELKEARCVILIQEKYDPRLVERIRNATAQRQTTFLQIGATTDTGKKSMITVRYNGRNLTELNGVVYPRKVEDGMTVDATVSDGLSSYMLAGRLGREWYFTSDQVDGTLGLVLADWLHEVLGIQHPSSGHEAFIRIEDVSPETDPAKLRAIADLLFARKIPFMVALIPVYSDASGHTESFEDKPEWTQALHYMVDHGASLIMHGYEHKYKNSETGEGFEFWDIDRDQPIQGEERYTADKLQKGIALMAKQGLYPLAFEPPHYAMSQKSYQIARQYFSTLVASLQLSDDTFEITQKTPYRLVTGRNGFKVIPETIGYVENSPAPCCRWWTRWRSK